jgi:hypothetical protein
MERHQSNSGPNRWLFCPSRRTESTWNFSLVLVLMLKDVKNIVRRILIPSEQCRTLPARFKDGHFLFSIWKGNFYLFLFYYFSLPVGLLTDRYFDDHSRSKFTSIWCQSVSNGRFASLTRRSISIETFRFEDSWL